MNEIEKLEEAKYFYSRMIVEQENRGRSNMEKAKCLLCGHDAERNVFSDAPDPTKVAGGYKYICPEYGLYALNDYEYSWVEHFASNEQKSTLSEYMKENTAEEGYFKVLRWEDIQRILGLPSKRRG